MKDELTNSVNMINATIAYADANAAATAGIPAFVTTLAVVKGKIVLINGLNQIGGGSTKGVTTDTNLLRAIMTEMALKCAKGTLAYANSINNNTLKEKVNYSQRALDKLKKEDVDDVCQEIHDAANANAAAVANFGVGASDFTDLQTAINVYRTASQNPRAARISITQAKADAEVMVKGIVRNDFEGLMDKMVDTLKSSNLTYWKGYRQAREVINLGSTTAKVRGDVRDVNTSPLKGVKFTIYETGTTTAVGEDTTDTKGNFGISKLPAGNFDFKWEVDGYKTVKETNVHIAAGKELKRKITMVAALIVVGEVKPEKYEAVDGITGPIAPTSEITIEVTDVDLRFYATNDPNNAPGATFLDVPAGGSVTYTALELTALLGIDASNYFINVQNNGLFEGHYKITIVK